MYSNSGVEYDSIFTLFISHLEEAVWIVSLPDLRRLYFGYKGGYYYISPSTDWVYASKPEVSMRHPDYRCSPLITSACTEMEKEIKRAYKAGLHEYLLNVHKAKNLTYLPTELKDYALNNLETILGGNQ